MPDIKVLAILYIGLALIVGIFSSKLMKLIHFPNVTGYLLSGILIGPWLLGLINQELFNNILKEVSWMSEVALGFIAFTIGGSFKLSALKRVGKRATIISIFEALGGALIVVGGLLIAYFLGMKSLGLTIPMILIFGSIACATAPAATLLVVNQYKARGPVTETLIPVVAFDDAVALIAFSVMFAMAKIMQIGAAFDFVEAILIPLLEIVLSIVLGAAIGWLLGLLTKIFKSRHNRLIAIIASVIICVGISQINFGSLFNLPISFQLSSLLTVMGLGAFYANTAKGIDTTYEFLDKFTAPLFMVFFILSGANLNFGIFATPNAGLVIVIAIIYLLSRVVGKWSGAMVGSSITKCEKNVRKYLGFALIPQAGVALGLAGNANKFLSSVGHEELGTLIFTVIIISTMIYELSGPLVTKWALTKSGEIKNPNRAKL